MTHIEAKDPLAGEVLDFWFPGTGRDARWFRKDEAFDTGVRSRYLRLVERAASGGLSGWKGAAGDCLALILLLDQFPRNAFRGTGRAFSGDALAREAARHAIDRSYDAGMRPVEKLFVYLPFEHSESLVDQDLACELLRPLAAFAETEDVYRYALAHREVIVRFGRFPHRNALLGRPSTPEELEFLKQPGSGF